MSLYNITLNTYIYLLIQNINYFLYAKCALDATKDIESMTQLLTLRLLKSIRSFE